MSIEPESTTMTRPTLGAHPFADLRADQVLKCRDPETGWQWFYTRDSGTVLKYHERDGYAPPPTALCEVAETGPSRSRVRWRTRCQRRISRCTRVSMYER